MKIAAKGTLEKDKLQVVLDQGLKYIEFHTFADDFFKIGFAENLVEIKKMLDLNNVQCIAIHLPIIEDNDKCERYCFGNFYYDNRDEYISLLKRVIDSTKILCDYDNPIVVCHIGTGYFLNDEKFNNLTNDDITMQLCNIADDLFEIDRYIDDNDLNVTLVVENMPKHFYRDERIVSWYFGTESDLPNFISSLRLNHVKTCLDICHAYNSIYINNISNPYNKINIEKFIRDYKDSVGLIHLNNLALMGEMVAVHSQPFSVDNTLDMKKLESFFDCIVKYQIDCPITLEINEDNYFKRDNLIKTITSIKKFL